jgi:hypothetical protein
MTQRRQRDLTVINAEWEPWEPEEQAPQSSTLQRTSNFVAPLPQSTIVRRADAPGFDLSAMPALHTSEAVDQSNELERSKGFVWRVAPLAMGFGAGVGGVVLLAGGNATGAIVALFLVFAAVWGGAFVYHISRSPAGVAYMQSRSLWGVIEREQRYRHSVDWHERTRDR